MRLLVVGAPKYLAHVACTFVQMLVFICDFYKILDLSKH